MQTVLVVGDVHAEAHDLADCEALLGLVHRTANDQKVDAILFTGDQFNNHDSVSVVVQDFWRRWFGELGGARKVWALVGNHDQSDPTKTFPNAMAVYSQLVLVVDRPTEVVRGVAAMPYFYDPAEFIAAENSLHSGGVGPNHLFCHATFQGAKYDNGFYAKDAVDLTKVMTSRITSGHIHATQKVGDRVLYVGAPRWRTASDAPTANRAIWLFTFDDEGQLRGMKPVRTDSACRRIYCLEDRPEAPAVLELTPDMLGRAQVRVKVFGPTPEYVRAREAVWRSGGARTQGFPDRVVHGPVRESDGLGASFLKFAHAFAPPRGSSRDALLALLTERGVAWG